jgi:hypothetical protein
LNSAAAASVAAATATGVRTGSTSVASRTSPANRPPSTAVTTAYAMTRLMIRSIAYSRYFSTATPTHTGRMAIPSVPATCQYEVESLEASALMTAEITSVTAPVYSHLSCCLRSPAERR